MRTVIKETRFYKTSSEGLTLFNGDKLKGTMKLVNQFCLDKKVIRKEVKSGFGSRDSAPDAQLRFDPSYMEAVRDQE